MQDARNDKPSSQEIILLFSPASSLKFVGKHILGLEPKTKYGDQQFIVLTNR